MCVDARQPSAQCEQEQHRSLFCSIRLASNNYATRSEEHTSELQSQSNLVCRLLLEKKKTCVCAASPTRPSPARIATANFCRCTRRLDFLCGFATLREIKRHAKSMRRNTFRMSTAKT